jgi:non-ribosomal peptide synthase protein (TIGR01720 family)
LLIVIHHLAVDSVSWRILLEDLWRAYEHLAHGQAMVLPQKTSSLRQWANRLRELAQSPKVRSELPYWIAAATAGTGQVPVDLPRRENIASAAITVTVELDEENTRSLIQETPKVYQTQINDVLLTALAQVLAAWSGEKQVRFDLEGHGREPLFDDIDHTRTVGWFTTIFPVRLDVTTNHPGELLKSVKEQLSQIPNRGLSYGLLRYLTNDPDVNGRLTALSGPDVAFNYLGQFSAIPELESTGQARSGGARRHLIEINAEIWGARLRVHWEYSKHHHRRSTIERVAADFITRLCELIAHCRSPKQAGFTPSDFEQAGINQKDLDTLVAAVEKSERQAG